jgi:hypothetical protein
MTMQNSTRLLKISLRALTVIPQRWNELRFLGSELGLQVNSFPGYAQ